MSQDREEEGSTHSTRGMKGTESSVPSVRDRDLVAGWFDSDSPTSVLFRIPLHAGNVEQPQNSLPALRPLRATRKTISEPHSGHWGTIRSIYTFAPPDEHSVDAAQRQGTGVGPSFLGCWAGTSRRARRALLRSGSILILRSGFAISAMSLQSSLVVLRGGP